ncbi:MAG: 50S ribosomal protein L21e [Candidatus Pacearchaeota archaeon]|jgi:large subunit ribosomal protein L21e|nr:50S ribosomal protein L21e [Candidatus Pacearchaeota archaeon]
MTGRKDIRHRGKIKFSEYFQKFENDDRVAVNKEVSVTSSFPERLQGRTGVVTGKRGRSYIVKIKDQTMEKEFIIAPVHLRKIGLENQK